MIEAGDVLPVYVALPEFGNRVFYRAVVTDETAWFDGPFEDEQCQTRIALEGSSMTYELVTIEHGKEVSRDTSTNYDAAAAWFKDRVLNGKGLSYQVIACPTAEPFPMLVLDRSWVAMRS